MKIGKMKCRIVIALCVVSSAVVVANPGDFEPTFNGVGFARDFLAGFDDRSDLALQLSGEIVTIRKSDFGPALWRRLPDGTLDTSFGGTGTVLPPAPPDYFAVRN